MTGTLIGRDDARTIAKQAPALTAAPDMNVGFWGPRLKHWFGTAQGLHLYSSGLEATEDNEQSLAEMLTQIRASRKHLDEIRLQSTKPYRDAASFLNGQFKKISAVLDRANSELDGKVRAVLNMRREREAAERREREEWHRQTMEKLRKEADERVDTAPPPQPDKGLKSPLASVKTRKQRVVNIDDIGALPIKYLVPNRDLIRRDALNGVDIPGVSISEQEITTTRIKGA